MQGLKDSSRGCETSGNKMHSFAEFTEAADPWVKNKDKIIQGKYLRLGDAMNRSQIKSLNKIREFKAFIDTGMSEVVVRKDESIHKFQGSVKHYVMGNMQQKYILKVSISDRGKLYNYTVYKKTGNVLDIMKNWSIDD